MVLGVIALILGIVAFFLWAYTKNLLANADKDNTVFEKRSFVVKAWRLL